MNRRRIKHGPLRETGRLPEPEGRRGHYLGYRQHSYCGHDREAIRGRMIKLEGFGLAFVSTCDSCDEEIERGLQILKNKQS